MSNLVKANNTRTQLLTYINNESLTYIKERNLSKINGETAEKLLSKYGPYEVKIDNPIIIGAPVRRGRVRTKKQLNYIEKKEEEDLENQGFPDISNYFSLLEERKVLFFKYKLPILKKNHSFDRKKSKLNNFDSEKITKDEKIFINIKESLVALRKMSNNIKSRKKLMSPELLNVAKTKPNQDKLISNSKIIKPKTIKSTKNVSFKSINKFDNYSFKIDLYKVSDIYEKPNTNDNTSDVQRNINKKYSHQNEIKMTHFGPILSQLINTERGVHISCSILNNDILGSN